MQAPAFMAFGDVRQAVGGLEGEFFENFHGMTCKAGVSRAVCDCQCGVSALWAQVTDLARILTCFIGQPGGVRKALLLLGP